MPIEWRAAIAIDGGVIDDDHKRLIAIINSFERAHSTPWDMTAVLEDLKLYASRHFRREEELQREICYPGADQHHLQHEALLARLDNIIAEFKRTAGDDLHAVAAHTSQLLADWLLNHIIASDRKLRPYLGQK